MLRKKFTASFAGQPETSEPEFIKAVDVHAFAHCLWWVEVGDEMPADADRRNEMWQAVTAVWIDKAHRVLWAMKENGMFVRNR